MSVEVFADGDDWDVYDRGRTNPRSALLREQYLRNELLLDQLAEERERQGLSQRQVAERMGSRQPQVWRLESGQLDPRQTTIARYAAALDLEIHYQVRRAGTGSVQTSENNPTQAQGVLFVRPEHGAPYTIVLSGQVMPVGVNIGEIQASIGQFSPASVTLAAAPQMLPGSYSIAIGQSAAISDQDRSIDAAATAIQAPLLEAS